MRAIVVRRLGPPQVLELQQLPEPQIKPGEVLVRVRAIGVNFSDLLQRMGLYPDAPKPPFIPGVVTRRRRRESFRRQPFQRQSSPSPW